MKEWSASNNKVAETWATLSEMYGSQLARVYGELVPSAWARTIASMDQYRLAAGLRNLIQHGSGTVPTLPQFVKACHQSANEGMERNHSPETKIAQQYDAIHCHAQRCMFAFLWQRDGASNDSISKMITIKNKVVNDFKMIQKEEVVTGSEIRDALFKAWDSIWQRMPEEEQRQHRDSFIATGFTSGMKSL